MSDASAYILVVDDNEMNRDMLSRRLERQGYRVDVAVDGRDALQRLQAPGQPYNLVMLDIMMPQVNGYEVLEQVKADPILREVPVIMISAVNDLESVVKCIEMGAEDYLFKPFNPVLLKARISATLERQRHVVHPDTLRPLVQAIQADAEILARAALPDDAQAAAERIRSSAQQALDALKG